MGDRTNAYLEVRISDHAEVEKIIEEGIGGFDEVCEGVSPVNAVPTIEYTFYDVNYADLKIENILQERRIPYDKWWDAGCEYPAGSEIFRIDDNGEAIVKEFDANTEGMVHLDDLIKAFELNRVGEYIAEMRQEVWVMPWNQQDEILKRLGQGG